MADVDKTHARSVTSIRKPDALLRGMARHPELWCMLLAFLITLVIKYSQSFKSKPVTLPPREPQYMFPPASSVVDSPRGSLHPLIHLLKQEEFVIVMYYAPWCSRSQAARAEYLKAANFLRGKVAFAAVNCWWPEGECRNRYKFLMFPVLMAYHTNLDGYRFSGNVRAELLVKFVEDLLYPLSTIHSKLEALEMVAKHETVVVGYFNLTSVDHVNSYRQFYYAAMRIVERDHFQPVKFAILSNSSVAKQLRLFHSHGITLLRLFNESLVFPFPHNVTSTNIVKWVLHHKDRPSVMRLSPAGQKSRVLSDELNRGPAFIMFHIENPLFQIEPAVKMLKAVVLQFRHCRLNPLYRDILTVWKELIQKDVGEYRHMVQMCELLKRSHEIQRRALTCCISAVVQNSNYRPGKVCSICGYGKGSCQLFLQFISSILQHCQYLPPSCHNVVVSYHWADKLSVCCHKSNESDFASSPWVQYKSGMRETVRDGWNSCVHSQECPYSTKSPDRRLTDRYVRHHLETLPRQLCDRLSLERQQGLRSHFSTSDLDLHLDMLDKAPQFSKVGCSSNTSLHFFSMDSQTQWMFSDRLGINPSTSNSVMPTAVLFDKDNEEHYVMKENLTQSSTMSFILNYEYGRLQRHQQSHSFPRQSLCSNNDAFCVEELNSTSFKTVVNDDNKDVLVLIYAHGCGFCQTFSHTYLTLAHYFSPSQHITFTRINGQTNDLPWEFTFDLYPTVIFFPARRKADSIVFPSEKEKTLANMVRFVLRHATHDTRFHLAADVCLTTCIQQNLRRSLKLMEKLQRRETRLQLRLHQISSSSEADNIGYYSKQGIADLTRRLSELHVHTQNVKKLASYLRDIGNSSINKQKLVDLFSSLQKKSSGG